MRCVHVSEVHGSRRKFLNAGRLYRADVRIMGGHLVTLNGTRRDIALNNAEISPQ
jgi:Icc-related predicted phosphoesterase